MFCANCGKELRDGDRFCPFCGAPMRNLNGNDDSNRKQVSTSKEHIYFDWDNLDLPGTKNEKKPIENIVFDWEREPSKTQSVKDSGLFRDKELVERTNQEIELGNSKRRASGLREEYTEETKNIEEKEQGIDSFTRNNSKSVSDWENEIFNSYIGTEKSIYDSKEEIIEEKKEEPKLENTLPKGAFSNILAKIKKEQQETTETPKTEIQNEEIVNKENEETSSVIPTSFADILKNIKKKETEENKEEVKSEPTKIIEEVKEEPSIELTKKVVEVKETPKKTEENGISGAELFKQIKSLKELSDSDRESIDDYLEKTIIYNKKDINKAIEESEENLVYETTNEVSAVEDNSEKVEEIKETEIDKAYEQEINETSNIEPIETFENKVEETTEPEFNEVLNVESTIEKIEEVDEIKVEEIVEPEIKVEEIAESKETLETKIEEPISIEEVDIKENVTVTIENQEPVLKEDASLEDIVNATIEQQIKNIEVSDTSDLPERLDDKFLTFARKNEEFDELLQKEKEKLENEKKEKEELEVSLETKVEEKEVEIPLEIKEEEPILDKEFFPEEEKEVKTNEEGFTKSVDILSDIADSLNNKKEEEKVTPRVTKMTLTGLDLDKTFDFEDKQKLNQIENEVLNDVFDTSGVDSLKSTLDDFYKQDDEPKKRKHILIKIIIALLILLILFEVAIVVSKYVMPDSKFAQVISSVFDKFTDLIDSIL